MPIYEFRCRSCGSTFTQTRPMSASGDPARCPDGHDDTVRLLGIAAVAGNAGQAAPSGGGGCCGGSCGCG